MEKINTKDVEEVEISTDGRFKWYALMCIPNHEKSVKKHINSNLRLKGLESWVDLVHVPTMKDISVKNGKRVERDKIMIPGYILVHMDIENGEVMPCIRGSKGVSSWLNTRDGKASQRPEVMRNRDVDKFLNVAAESNNNIEVDFVIGENIKLTSGSFSGFSGEIDSINGEKLKVEVLIFGRETMVDVNKSDVEKI